MESTTAGTLVITGPKRLVHGPRWNLNLRFPACRRTQRTNAFSSFPCSVSSKKGMSVPPLEKDMFIAPVHSLFVLLEHSCMRTVVSSYP